MDELRAVAAAAESWGADEHPATVQLLAEFDERAVFRSDDGEGFFNRNTASQFISKCEDLDLAVVEMDGLRYDGNEVASVEGLELEVPDQPMMTWSEFRAFANANAHGSLDNWPTDEDLVVAFVFRQPDGEDIVA